MGKIIAISTSAIAALVVGALTLGYSPPGCSCIDTVTALAFHAGYERVTEETDLSPAAIEASMNSHLVGSDVLFGQYPYTSEDGCKKESSQLIVCKVPGGRSLLVTRGYKVTYQLQNGKLQHATVVRAHWLGP